MRDLLEKYYEELGISKDVFNFTNCIEKNL